MMLHVMSDSLSSEEGRSRRVWIFGEESVIRRLADDGLHRWFLLRLGSPVDRLVVRSIRRSRCASHTCFTLGPYLWRCAATQLIEKHREVSAKQKFDMRAVKFQEASIKLSENKYISKKPYRSSMSDQK
jgi:hypothetical protein